MPLLAGHSGKIAMKKFEHLGYRVVRQRGSHVRLKHPTDPRCRPLTIPLHKELKIGLLAQTIKDANITIKEFLAL